MAERKNERKGGREEEQKCEKAEKKEEEEVEEEKEERERERERERGGGGANKIVNCASRNCRGCSKRKIHGEVEAETEISGGSAE
jgi:hypothetical protein